MKSLNKIFLSAMVLGMLIGCGESNKADEAAKNEKKAKLENLQKEQAKLASEISALELELNNGEAKTADAKLITIDTIREAAFSHFIELQGKVDADNISIVTPRGAGGQVKQVFVKKGDIVKKGQLLLKLDDAIYQQNIRTSSQSIQTLRTQLELASEIFKRRQNLWSQGIGTEIELLNAKTNVETLNTQIKTSEEQVKLLQEQQKTTNVFAEVNGIADEVNVRVGEFFQGFIGNLPQIQIVNTSSLKAVTLVPENYADRVVRGSMVSISIPDINKSYNSTISFLGASIDPSSRSFQTEAKLPSDPLLKPNMVAMVKILDYAANSAISIPVNVIQNDEKGKYVFVMEKSANKMVARKKPVAVGQIQGEVIEIKSGLEAGQILITAGYQGLYDGQLVATVSI